jgi:hypothetical protein
MPAVVHQHHRSVFGEARRELAKRPAGAADAVEDQQRRYIFVLAVAAEAAHVQAGSIAALDPSPLPPLSGPPLSG